MGSDNTLHVRRAHYSGKYPKRYEEKYKELDPEKYSDTVAAVIRKGSTPAGMHIPICVKEILDFFKIQPGQTGLDATLGYGGHTLEMLKALKGEGHIYALDIDAAESGKTKARLEKLGYGPEMLTVLNMNFADIDELMAAGSGPFDFILADLGVSSMQLDNPERGFSYKNDGPLDLRMNQETGITAAERLMTVERDELKGMLIENADEPYADEISGAICSYIKKGGRIDTTTALRHIIEDALSFIPAKERHEEVRKSCQRTFQALRIDINDEYESLYSFLEKIPASLVPGGRVAILTFHSGEDRLVKQSFKRYYSEGAYSDISKEVIRPSAEECRNNPRAGSAKMRWAVRS